MKSLEETKAVLQCCIDPNERCAECPNNGDVTCVDNALRDSLECIEHLEKELQYERLRRKDT